MSVTINAQKLLKIIANVINRGTASKRSARELQNRGAKLSCRLSRMNVGDFSACIGSINALRRNALVNSGRSKKVAMLGESKIKTNATNNFKKMLTVQAVCNS